MTSCHLMKSMEIITFTDKPQLLLALYEILLKQKIY